MIQSYPWYIADWRESETRIRLSLAERALYREMLDYCYLEGSLPSDPVQLSRICGCSVADVRRHFEVVSSLFSKNGDRLTHSKVTEVRAKLDAYHKQKAHAGAASGRTRRQRAIERETNARSTADEPSPTPAPEPTPEPAPTVRAVLAVMKSTTSPEEDLLVAYSQRMYAVHPKKKNLALVVDALQAAVKRGYKLADIEVNHLAWAESAEWRKEAGRYCPQLASWIADDGFTTWPLGREPTKQVKITQQWRPYDPSTLEGLNES